MQSVIKAVYFKVFLCCQAFVCILANKYFEIVFWRSQAGPPANT